MVIGTLVYLATLIILFAMLAAMPVVFLSEWLAYRKRRANLFPVAVPLIITGAYLAGGMAGWMLRPAEWTFPFLKTISVAGDAETYGHTVEHAAEIVLMYPLHFAALGAVLGAIGAWLIRPRTRSAHS